MELKQIKIKSIKKLEQKRHVYDISVEGNHNFFIGNTETLTHNCDYLTPVAQAALRNLMETFSKSTRFILTCNYPEKVIDPIQSRCQTFEIIPPTKKDVAKRLNDILINEGIQFEMQDLLVIVNSGYPDIRRVINAAQRQVINGRLVIDKQSSIESTYSEKIVDILKSGVDTKSKFTQILSNISRFKSKRLYKVVFNPI